jgi:malate synthase
LLDEELARIHRELGPQRVANGVFPSAARLFAAMVLSEEFDEFLTLPAYQLLD